MTQVHNGVDPQDTRTGGRVARALAAWRGTSRRAGLGRAGALAALGATLLAAAWASASPVGASPDEEAHVIYAYGVATGQTLPGSERTAVVNRVPQTVVQIPTELLRVPDRHCYSFAVGTPAGCPPDARPGTGAEVETYMSRYPPVYYLVAGTAMRAGMWAGLPGPTTLWLVRLLSGLVCGALVLLAVRTTARRLPPRAVVTAAVVACTPVAASLFSAVNPNGFEIAAAVLVAALVVAVRADVAAGRPVRRATQLALLGALVLLAGARPLGVVWAGAAAVLLLVPVPGVRGIPLRRLAWWTTAGGVAIHVVGLAWVLYAMRFRGAENEVGDVWQTATPVGRVALIVLQLGDMLRTATSSFGWGEVVLPELGIHVVLISSTALVAAQLTGRRPGEWRAAPAVAFLVLCTLAVAVVSYRDAFGWQGRYWLPVLAATVVLLVPAMHGRALDSASGRRSVLTGVALLQLMGVAALAWNVLRYAYGIGYVEGRFPPVPRIEQAAEWAPVGGIALVLAAAAVGAVLVTWAVALAVPPAVVPATPAEPVDASGAAPEPAAR